MKKTLNIKKKNVKGQQSKTDVILKYLLLSCQPQ